jgi:hypothetical protein
MRVALAVALLALVAVACDAPITPAPEVADIRTRGMSCGEAGKTTFVTFAPGQSGETLEGHTAPPTDGTSQWLPSATSWQPGPGAPILYGPGSAGIVHSDGELRLIISGAMGSGSKSLSTPCTINGDPPAPGATRTAVLN